MNVYQLEILNPEAQALLESLVKLKLIRLQKIEVSGKAFMQQVEQLRSQHAEEGLSEEDIAREVETVRTARYARQTESHH